MSTDKKKQMMFKQGLKPRLYSQLVSHIYPDFNTLVSQSVLTEEAQSREDVEKKHKFDHMKSKRQDRGQSSRFNPQQRFRQAPPMQYRTQSAAPPQPAQSYRTQNSGSKQQGSSMPVGDTQKVCYNCRQPGHSMANCPQARNPANVTHATTAPPARSAASGNARGSHQSGGQQRRSQ